MEPADMEEGPARPNGVDARPCRKGDKCFTAHCPYYHSDAESRVFCPLGERCGNEACSRGRHPPLCQNGYYCPDRSSSCRFRHYSQDNYSNGGSKRNKGLLILVELDHTLICRTTVRGNAPPLPGDGLRLRPGAVEFMRWLRIKCTRDNVRAAFYTHLPSEEARSLAAALDRDGVLYVFADGYSKPDPSEGGGGTETMCDVQAVWRGTSTPGEGKCPFSTIVVDNNVRRMREYPYNLVYVPPFGQPGLSDGNTFDLRTVCEYLDVVLRQWSERIREKLVNKDIRKFLQWNLNPNIRREGRLLILLDLNGTLLFRSMDTLPTEKSFYKHRDDQRKYYYRPFAHDFVAYLLEQRHTNDCVQVAFYSSMTGKNATAAAGYLDSTHRMHVYPRNYNQRDLASDNEWAVIRDLHAVWGAAGTPGFEHTARSTVMIDDTCRKLREFPENLVQVPEYTAESVVQGEGFHLQLLKTHIEAIVAAWQTDYTFGRDVRSLLKPLNETFSDRCAAAEKQFQSNKPITPPAAVEVEDTTEEREEGRGSPMISPQLPKNPPC